VNRASIILFFALLTFQVSGLGAMCVDAPCNEDCPADASGGQCAPNCHFCSCSPLQAFAKPATLGTDLGPSFVRASWTQPVDTRSSPYPAAILHVPKLPLA
jgi:hypothetical protein